MDIEEIKNKINLRYPYLLVDRVVECNEEKLVALKNVTINEPFFQGHFPEPGPSVMPGTMILEGMAQVSGILAQEVLGEEEIGYLVGVDGAKFRRKVTPGDQLEFRAEMKRARANLCKVAVRAYVGEELSAEATITLAFRE
ncbi:MAG: 3-hydroxyacyl-ACP dehydratase FabZ [Candidatus Bipolaricaulia bacterium]